MEVQEVALNDFYGDTFFANPAVCRPRVLLHHPAEPLLGKDRKNTFLVMTTTQSATPFETAVGGGQFPASSFHYFLVVEVSPGQEKLAAHPLVSQIDVTKHSCKVDIRTNMLSANNLQLSSLKVYIRVTPKPGHQGPTVHFIVKHCKVVICSNSAQQRSYAYGKVLHHDILNVFIPRQQLVRARVQYPMGVAPQVAAYPHLQKIPHQLYVKAQQPAPGSTECQILCSLSSEPVAFPSQFLVAMQEDKVSLSDILMCGLREFNEPQTSSPASMIIHPSSWRNLKVDRIIKKWEQNFRLHSKKEGRNPFPPGCDSQAAKWEALPDGDTLMNLAAVQIVWDWILSCIEIQQTMPLLAQLNLPIITFTSFVNDILLNPSTPHREESLVIRFGSEAGGIIVTSLTPEGSTYHHLFTQKKGGVDKWKNFVTAIKKRYVNRFHYVLVLATAMGPNGQPQTTIQHLPIDKVIKALPVITSSSGAKLPGQDANSSPVESDTPEYLFAPNFADQASPSSSVGSPASIPTSPGVSDGWEDNSMMSGVEFYLFAGSCFEEWSNDDVLRWAFTTQVLSPAGIAILKQHAVDGRTLVAIQRDPFLLFQVNMNADDQRRLIQGIQELRGLESIRSLVGEIEPAGQQSAPAAPATFELNDMLLNSSCGDVFML